MGKAHAAEEDYHRLRNKYLHPTEEDLRNRGMNTVEGPDPSKRDGLIEFNPA